MQSAIFLRDYDVLCFIGIHDFEQGIKQRVRFNIRLDLAYLIPQKDDIAQVFDYDFLRTSIAELTTHSVFQTQEYLLGQVMKLCFKSPLVQGVCIETNKIDVYPDCGGVGCLLDMTRAEWHSRTVQPT